MDTFERATLSRVHSTLFTDLGKICHFIDPCNDRAQALVSQALEHLCDLEELAENRSSDEDLVPDKAVVRELDYVDSMHSILDKARCSALMLGAAAASEEETAHKDGFLGATATIADLIQEAFDRVSAWHDANREAKS